MGKRGVSPVIGTFVLIALMIAGLVVVYKLFYSSSAAVSSKPHVPMRLTRLSQEPLPPVEGLIDELKIQLTTLLAYFCVCTVRLSEKSQIGMLKKNTAARL